MSRRKSELSTEPVANFVDILWMNVDFVIHRLFVLNMPQIMEEIWRKWDDPWMDHDGCKRKHIHRSQRNTQGVIHNIHRLSTDMHRFIPII